MESEIVQKNRTSSPYMSVHYNLRDSLCYWHHKTPTFNLQKHFTPAISCAKHASHIPHSIDLVPTLHKVSYQITTTVVRATKTALVYGYLPTMCLCIK